MFTMFSYGELKAQRPTGRVRGRAGWFGRIIMQVEILSPIADYPRPPRPGSYDPWKNGSLTFWRDATAEDLASGTYSPKQTA